MRVYLFASALSDEGPPLCRPPGPSLAHEGPRRDRCGGPLGREAERGKKTKSRATEGIQKRTSVGTTKRWRRISLSAAARRERAPCSDTGSSWVAARGGGEGTAPVTPRRQAQFPRLLNPRGSRPPISWKRSGPVKQAEEWPRPEGGAALETVPRSAMLGSVSRLRVGPP
ncbi:hypothetical protein AAFF_G00058740 [Aldrovandia affinis]|uniref:Uncharacterized protein n=1 Tax=Aldrovandia affinis TaxID=143900 RepID=A0AAD7S0D3_9TELE|nr:hypothetical protein AAFF_G00058740 [Aldrovandia affinis]